MLFQIEGNVEMNPKFTAAEAQDKGCVPSQGACPGARVSAASQ